MTETKIRQHPASPTSVETFIAMLGELSDDIEHIACVVQYKNGQSEVFNTQMTSGNIAWLRWVFDQDFRPSD